jgi:hypothetical protein
MQRPQSHKKGATIRLSGSLEKRLIAYAAAASAAGVGVLAGSLPAEGKVITTLSWTQITPDTSKVNLDLNNDGIPDFQFSNRIYGTSVGRNFYGLLKILPQSQGNAIWGSGTAALALGSGVTIGSNNKLQASHQFMVRGSFYQHYYSIYGSKGPWIQTTRKYLGFKFTIQGEIHYGWARLNVGATNGGVYAAVTKYAYETEPNTPIVTGQNGGAEKNRRPQRRKSSGAPESAPPTTGSLGNLAAGALGSSGQQRPNAGRN